MVDPYGVIIRVPRGHQALRGVQRRSVEPKIAVQQIVDAAKYYRDKSESRTGPNA
jgi:hypothetical protein